MAYRVGPTRPVGSHGVGEVRETGCGGGRETITEEHVQCSIGAARGVEEVREAGCNRGACHLHRVGAAQGVG